MIQPQISHITGDFNIQISPLQRNFFASYKIAVFSQRKISGTQHRGECLCRWRNPPGVKTANEKGGLVSLPVNIGLPKGTEGNRRFQGGQTCLFWRNMFCFRERIPPNFSTNGHETCGFVKAII